MALFDGKTSLEDARAALVKERDQLQAKIDVLDGLTGDRVPNLDTQEAHPATRRKAPAKTKKKATAKRPARKPAKKQKRRNMAEPIKAIFERDPKHWWEVADIVRVAVADHGLEIPADDLPRAISVFQITLAKWCRTGRYERKSNDDTGRMMYRPRQAGS